ncbi:tyrosine-type recombinase/integrase [Streptomyces sp. NPDC102364]|uniref:tyrosine-type recombinase/integrase n=1 Tax=Streptomyces sp. NPDC102364 TaxID=3366161 RepID=UPI003807EFB6
MIIDSYAAGTVKRRIGTLTRLLRHAGIADPAQITVDHVRAFLARGEFQPWTIIGYLQDIAAYAEFAGIPDPTATIRRPREPDGLPDPLTDPAVATLRLEAGKLADPTLLQWINLGLFQGFRASDTANIRAENFDLWADRIRLKGKYDQDDPLPLAPVVRRSLGCLAHGKGRLYPGVTPPEVSAEVAIFAAKFGIRMRYHQLRHTFGTNLYRTTKDLMLTQRLMRHRAIKNTLKYAKLFDQDAIDAIRNLPGAN